MMKEKVDSLMHASHELAALVFLVGALDEYQNSYYEDVQALVDEAGKALNSAMELLDLRATVEYETLVKAIKPVEVTSHD